MHDAAACVSGRAPSGLTLEKIVGDGYSESNRLPVNHGYCVTVPGAAAAWIDTLQTFGNGKVGGIHQGISHRGKPISLLSFLPYVYSLLTG